MTPYRYQLFLLFMLAGLSACVSTTEVAPPCCYEGEVALNRLHQLTIKTTSGSTLSVQQALPGFKPQTGYMTSSLPFNKVDSEDIIYASLEPLLAIYDSNRTGTLEKPEVLLLYLREAITGLGLEVVHIGNPAPIRALAIPAAEVGGLVQFVTAHRGQMNARAQKVFADLDFLGSDLLSRGSQGGADGQGHDFSND